MDEHQLRWSYDPFRSYLQIKIPSPLHDAFFFFFFFFFFSRYLSTFLDACEDAHVFSRDQKRAIKVTQTGQTLAGSLKKESAKKEAWNKYPGGLFERRCGQEYIPVVVVEVGFSQNHRDLLVDMQQWLHKTNSVNAVILLDIDEVNKPNPKRPQADAEARLQSPNPPIEVWECPGKGREYDRQ